MNNSNLRYINTALAGAKYHEDQAFQVRGNQPNDYNKIVFHLRAYFWELWSAWDYVLQETNRQTFHLEPHEVRRNILNKVRKEVPDYKFLELLESIQENERLKRIMWLRDHAHKWQIEPYMIDHDDEKVNIIALNNLDSRDKFLDRQINIDRNDLYFMQEFINSLSKEGFFEA